MERKMNHSEAGLLGYFASKETNEKKKMERVEKYNESPTLCKVCGKPLPYNKRHNKFCSNSCSATYNNKLRTVEQKCCKICGKPLKNKNSIYCSSECHKTSMYIEYIERWKQGEENGLKGEYLTSSYIKKYLMEKYDKSCQICGWSMVNPHTGNIPLEIHHIDGDYTNNKEENLQLLCPNCHSLTENYKNANKIGRKDRKKYTKN